MALLAIIAAVIKDGLGKIAKKVFLFLFAQSIRGYCSADRWDESWRMG